MTNAATETNILNQFRQRFEEIKNAKSDSYIKSVRLAALMTDLEGVYKIPSTGTERIEAFKRAFPEEMKLYREVSAERSF